jgi:nicotinic acid mononucleotide adenylyltransferase
VIGGGRGKSQIQSWQRGKEIWHSLCWAVGWRPGFALDPADLPPKAMVFSLGYPGSSSAIRRRREKGQSIEGLVVPEVADYIDRYRLYLPGVEPLPPPELGSIEIR